jgi:multiple sugar transport system permease protein
MSMPFFSSDRTAVLPRDALAQRIRARLRHRLRRIALYAIVTGSAIVFLFPLYWMIITSLKPFSELFIFPPTLWPHALRFQNYSDAWTANGNDFTRYTLNTLFIAVTTMVGVLITASLCAFGFARLKFRGRDFIFLCVLASIMIPSQVTLIPLYIIFKQLQWLDSFKPLIIPAWFGGGAINIFLLRQFFLTIPRDLDEAARIDGCSTFGIFWRILLPLAKPVLAVVAIFQFQATWTDFLGPVIYLNSQQNFTIALGVYSFANTLPGGLPHQELLMAVGMLMVAPLALAFLLAQRLMVRGVVISGLKG